MKFFNNVWIALFAVLLVTASAGYVFSVFLPVPGIVITTACFIGSLWCWQALWPQPAPAEHEITRFCTNCFFARAPLFYVASATLSARILFLLFWRHFLPRGMPTRPPTR